MQAGTHLGPYEIVAPLGAGGMGEVWRARDQRLRREVAIKILLEGSAMPGAEALARFEREARAAAALSHPNILSIHDVGTDRGITYAVMELLEGATLRERLLHSEVALGRTLDWGHQIAQGLAAAHERGIIHRDLKPENIFVTRDGVVKILDFGLARLDDVPQPLVGQDIATLARTSPGTVVGTLAYLSPEQARGEVADPRSDIFAFGTVLYEMLTGKAAFLQNSAADTIVAILREEPTPPAEFGRNIPGEVQDILHHCLEKDPNERFRSARDLAFALRLASRTASAPPMETPRATPRPAESGSGAREMSIAVLPFRNMSPATDTEYFSDGMTEEIINSLSSVAGLHVAARTSSFAFKSRDDDIRKIGRDLGVAMLLEGSVRQSGSRLRVTAQLVNVENGYHLWSNRWDRDMADVFAVQDEIAEAIAATLKLRVVDKESEGAGKTQNVEAYDRYLKGRYLWVQRRTREAIVELDAAVERDPDFADAHTALADAWAVRGYYGGVPTWEAWARARAAVDEAQRIDPESAGVALSLGILEHYYGWNRDREEQFLRLAIQRNPKSADAWGWLAVGYAGMRRVKDAIEAGDRGIELEPHHANVRTSQAWAWVLNGEYEAAERALRKAVEIDPGAGYARWTLGIVLRYSGKSAESISIFEGLVNDSNRSVPHYLALQASALAAVGETARAEEIVAEIEQRRRSGEFVPSVDIARIRIASGDGEGALDALERARDERNAFLWGLIHLPDFIPLRNTPRWRALAERLGHATPFVGLQP